MTARNRANRGVLVAAEWRDPNTPGCLPVAGSHINIDAAAETKCGEQARKDIIVDMAEEDTYSEASEWEPRERGREGGGEEAGTTNRGLRWRNGDCSPSLRPRSWLQR